MVSRGSFQWVAVAAIAVALMGFVTLQAQNAVRARPVAVAVVDIEQVLKSLEERNHIQADFTSKQEQISRDSQKRKQEIESLGGDLSLYGPESSAYKETEQKLQEKTVEYRVWAELQTQALEREAAIQWEAMYRKIVNAVERTAKRDGYDLVLLKDDAAVTGPTQREVGEKIKSRKLLYASGELDITSQITQTLNNEFNARRKK